jgi:signal peptidase I
VTPDRPDPSPPSSSLDELWLHVPAPVATVSSWAVAAPSGPVLAPPAPAPLPPPPAPVVAAPEAPGLWSASALETGPDQAPSRPPHTRIPRRGGRWVIEWAVVLVVAVVVAFGIRTFAVQTFFIPSASMEPTLMIGDRILVDKISYHLHDVHRGDIVVFATPPGEDAGPNVKDLVKRVIGLPGETISSAGGMVVINGTPLKEPWLVPGTVTTGITTQKIPAGEYFVMGDNRSDSQDSRFFGPIHGSLIVGRVVVKIWPLTSFHFY